MRISDPTKFRLYALSGNKCAFPNCEMTLTNEENTNSKIGTYQIGQIAHIRAQSENGPRYDPDYPKDKLHDIDNLILLCGNCHKKIDSVENYSVDMLLKMKKDHESKIILAEISNINFSELSIACSALASNTYDKNDVDWTKIDINPKIIKNNLSQEVKNLLIPALSRSGEVDKFLSNQCQVDSKYADRLIKGFKNKYISFSEEYSGDELFYEMKNWAENVENNSYDGNIVALKAAGFVILCHLFEICEVFEK